RRLEQVASVNLKLFSCCCEDKLLKLSLIAFFCRRRYTATPNAWSRLNVPLFLRITLLPTKCSLNVRVSSAVCRYRRFTSWRRLHRPYLGVAGAAEIPSVIRWLLLGRIVAVHSLALRLVLLRH